MKRWMMITLVAIGAIAIGVGGAYAVNKLVPAQTAAAQENADLLNNWQMGPRAFNQQPGEAVPDQTFPANPQFRGGMGSRGMMGGQTYSDQTNNAAQRISLDQAVTNAEVYIKNQTTALKVSEVMEFQKNFYVAVTESDTGRGAMELLVDPVSGRVTPEIGPNMMWNLKYNSMRMMSSSSATDNTVTLDEARTKAQAALTAQGNGGTLNDGGFSFYGYYTFDYSINGTITGMLSVNGLDGQVMLHTWHGKFINEKEF